MEFTAINGRVIIFPREILSRDYLERVKEEKCIAVPFSYATLLWIKKRLLEEEAAAAKNPLEIIFACSYLLLKDLAWDFYLQNLEDTNLLASLNRMQTVIPPAHIKNRLYNANHWDVDIIDDNDIWSHYEENETSCDYIFQRKVGRNFSKIGKYGYYVNGEIFDVYRMTSKKLPERLSKDNVYFIEKSGEVLYFIIEEAIGRVCVYTWNGTTLTRYLKHTPRTRYNIDQCEYMHVNRCNSDSLIHKEYYGKCEYAHINCCNSVSLIHKEYYGNRAARLTYTRIYDGRDVAHNTGGPYHFPLEKISTAIRPFWGTVLVDSKFIIKEFSTFYEIKYSIRDSSSNLKAVYITHANELIGVYADGEGYLNFYKLKNNYKHVLEKGDDLIRRIKNIIISWDNVKNVYSADSDFPWMIPKTIKAKTETTTDDGVHSD